MARSFDRSAPASARRRSCVGTTETYAQPLAARTSGPSRPVHRLGAGQQGADQYLEAGDVEGGQAGKPPLARGRPDPAQRCPGRGQQRRRRTAPCPSAGRWSPRWRPRRQCPAATPGPARPGPAAGEPRFVSKASTVGQARTHRAGRRAWPAAGRRPAAGSQARCRRGPRPARSSSALPPDLPGGSRTACRGRDVTVVRLIGQMRRSAGG